MHWYNINRSHSDLDDIPPTEFKTTFYNADRAGKTPWSEFDNRSLRGGAFKACSQARCHRSCPPRLRLDTWTKSRVRLVENTSVSPSLRLVPIGPELLPYEIR